MVSTPRKNISTHQKMAIEVEDIVVTENSAEQEEEVESSKMEPEQEKAAPKRRGRPSDSRDKQPRKRARALPPVAEMEDDIEEVPRPMALRRSATARPSRRVVPVAVESEESTSAEGEEEEEPPSPRTKRHQEWSAYRQHKAAQHHEQVNRYARLFDRMLA